MTELETVLEEIEAEWMAGLEQVLRGLAQEETGDRLYALAFWGFYAETGAVIYPPAVGLGFEAGVAELYPDETLFSGFGSGFWNPAGWPVCAVEMPNAEALRQAYHRLASIACGGLDPEVARGLPAGSLNEAFWTKIFDRSLDPVRSVCLALTDRSRRSQGAFADLDLHPAFVAVMCDPSEGEVGELWLYCSTAEPLRSRLFPSLDYGYLGFDEIPEEWFFLPESFSIALQRGLPAVLASAGAHLRETAPDTKISALAVDFDLDGPTLDLVFALDTEADGLGPDPKAWSSTLRTTDAPLAEAWRPIRSKLRLIAKQFQRVRYLHPKAPDYFHRSVLIELTYAVTPELDRELREALKDLPLTPDCLILVPDRSQSPPGNEFERSHGRRTLLGIKAPAPAPPVDRAEILDDLKQAMAYFQVMASGSPERWTEPLRIATSWRRAIEQGQVPDVPDSLPAEIPSGLVDKVRRWKRASSG